MNGTKWIWRITALVSAMATLLFAAGFAYAVKDIVNPAGSTPMSSLPEPTRSPAETAGPLKVVVIGDSLAKGTGDNSGQGFARRAVQGLNDSGIEAELVANLGINGQTASQLASGLKQQGVRYTLGQADLILLSIGGNDLFQGADRMFRGLAARPGTETSADDTPEGSLPDNAGPEGAETGEGDGMLWEDLDDLAEDLAYDESELVELLAETGELTPENVLSAIPQASDRLRDVFAELRVLNADARILYVGLYNPFGDIADLRTPGNQAVTAWNSTASQLSNTDPAITLVPTFDLFEGHLDRYLSTDHFHPNGDGYQRMADRIVQAVH